MIEKTVEDNIADFTELTVDCLIANKIADSMIHVSKFVGSSLVQAGCELVEVIPPHLLDSTVEYMMNGAGELIAIADTTGESIDAAVAAAGKELLDSLERSMHFAAQSNNFSCKGGGNSNGGKPEVKPQPVEPKVGTPEWKKQPPHGEYNDAEYHIPESAKIKNSFQEGGKAKSPCPKNGQTCLDNSYGIKDCEHRAAIENGRYVVLCKTQSGTFHGFVCDDWSDVPRKIQAIFKEHKLVHSKSGEILKNFRN